MKTQLKMVAAATLLALGATAAHAGNSTNKFDVIVKLNADLAIAGHENNKSNAKNIAAGMGVGSVKHAYGSAYFGFAASVTEGRLNSLRNNPNVASVEYDGEKSINKGKPGSGGGTPSPQVMPWGISRTGADSNNNDGSGVHVYVLDTGLDSDHGDLAGNISNGFAAEQCKGKGCAQAWDEDLTRFIL